MNEISGWSGTFAVITLHEWVQNCSQGYYQHIGFCTRKKWFSCAASQDFVCRLCAPLGEMLPCLGPVVRWCGDGLWRGYRLLNLSEGLIEPLARGWGGLALL